MILPCNPVASIWAIYWLVPLLTTHIFPEASAAMPSQGQLAALYPPAPDTFSPTVPLYAISKILGAVSPLANQALPLESIVTAAVWSGPVSALKGAPGAAAPEGLNAAIVWPVPPT